MHPETRRCVAIVAEVYGYTPAKLLSRQRTLRLVEARFAAYWLARRKTGRTWEDLGRDFGRDQGAVRHGAGKYERMVGSFTVCWREAKAIGAML